MTEIDSQLNEYFLQLYFKSQRRLYGYVMAIVPSPSLADMIIQDSVSQMWENFNNYVPGNDFSEWAMVYLREMVLLHFIDKKSYVDFSEGNLQILKHLKSHPIVNDSIIELQSHRNSDNRISDRIK